MSLAPLSADEAIQLTEDQARQLVDRINATTAELVDLIEKAWAGQAWIALGYESWNDLCDNEITVPKLTVDQRRELVGALRSTGMSTRAIASSAGVGQTQVRRDLEAGEPNGSPADPAPITGMDGKSYPASRPVTTEDVRRAVRPDPSPVEEDEYDAILDELDDAGIPPTPEAVDQAITEAVESRKTPNIPTKPDLGGGVSHPARYTDVLLDAFVSILDELGAVGTILDPFAGTGKIHSLREHGYETTGIELEPEWAQMHPDTIVGSALELPFDEHAFDAVVTSPTYGNRLADSHNASDPERRRSYTHDLGRSLHPDNSGAMQWGAQYRRFHEAAWNEAYRILRPGGVMLLNIKDHVRNGKRQGVPAWHLHYLIELGFAYRWHVDVNTPSLRSGANSDARYAAETIFVMERGE